MSSKPDDAIWAWRHPRPDHIAGVCIGRTDVAVDPRRARRLARQIQRVARANQLPHEIWTSPLRRCSDVGRWLRRWGWVHHIDAALLEMDFGAWEGKPWSVIPQVEVEAWNRDFARFAPGGGEPVMALIERTRAWQGVRSGARSRHGAILMVAHAGWMRARRWCESSSGVPAGSVEFPAAPAYGAWWRFGAIRH